MKKVFVYLLVILYLFVFVSARPKSNLQSGMTAIFTLNNGTKWINQQLSMNINDTAKNECTGEEIHFSGEELITLRGHIKKGRVLVDVAFTMDKLVGRCASSGLVYKVVDNLSGICKGAFLEDYFTSTIKGKIKAVQKGGNKVVVLSVVSALTISRNGSIAVFAERLQILCH